MTLGTGALVWGAYEGAFPDQRLLAAVRGGQVGGVVLFARNAPSQAAVRTATSALLDAARGGGLPPVTIAADQEGGAVVRFGHRTIFPGAMALGATGDAGLIERVALATTAGLRADGIGVDLAPVCDVNSEPANPAIGTRSFGDDPAQVATCVAAWVRGSAAAGVASCTKHFPGHGAAAYDSHHTTVDVRADRALLDRRDLAPFRAAFAAGAPAAMTAHVRYPELDDAIATLSPAIATRLLRDDLGFTGLLLSDAFEMGGITAAGMPEALVPRAIAAGVDTVLLGAHGPIDQAWEWIAVGVRAPRVMEALARARRFRARFAIKAGPETRGDEQDLEAPLAGALALAIEAAERSLTLVGPALPNLARASTVRVVALPPDDAAEVSALRDPAARLERALRARLGTRLVFASGVPPEGTGPLVVCTWGARFDPARLRHAAALLDQAAVHCALRSPYDAGLGRPLPTLLTYCDVPASLDALATALAGALIPRGRSPVRLTRPYC